MSPSDANAEDVLQQALMQAWVALANPEIDVRDPRAWLYRIVHNVAISQLRRPVHDSLDVEAGGQIGGAEDEVERRLEARAALAGLASLPELQRRVMLSTALEGRSHDEVADALGLSHGAVRGLIYRARATLRAAAAAAIPSPIIHWAARQGAGSGRPSAVIEARAGGGGSVGLGGLLVKGGAVVAAAGALATAAGIAGHSGPRQKHAEEAGLLARPRAHGHATGLSSGAMIAVSASAASTAAGPVVGTTQGALKVSGSSGGRSGRASGRGGFGGPDLHRLVTTAGVSGSGSGRGSGSGSGHGSGHGDGGLSGGSQGSSGSTGSGQSRHGSGSSSGSGASGSDSGLGSSGGGGDSSDGGTTTTHD